MHLIFYILSALLGLLKAPRTHMIKLKIINVIGAIIFNLLSFLI